MSNGKNFFLFFGTFDFVFFCFWWPSVWHIYMYAAFAWRRFLKKRNMRWFNVSPEDIKYWEWDYNSNGVNLYSLRHEIIFHSDQSFVRYQNWRFLHFYFIFKGILTFVNCQLTFSSNLIDFNAKALPSKEFESKNLIVWYTYNPNTFGTRCALEMGSSICIHSNHFLMMKNVL